MATEELEVVISASGEVTITAKGFTGTSCLTATAGLESMLGGDVIERRVSDEVYNTQSEGASQQLNIGETPKW